VSDKIAVCQLFGQLSDASAHLSGLELSWSRDKTETVNVKTEIKIVTLKTKTVKLLS